MLFRVSGPGGHSPLPSEPRMSQEAIATDVTSDSLAPVLDHPIRLPVFEGPLDLLLFLIRRNEIDIYDIPIETVTRQYLEVLRAMDRLNLEVAGEFFVMAATLMYIKSRMLLPRNEELPQEDEEDPDSIDPRWELVQQLIEYKKFKEAATQLEDMIEAQQNILPRLFKESDVEERPLRPSDKIELWNVFNTVLRRLAEQMVQGEIHDDHVTVADRMEVILERIKSEKTFLFSSLIPKRTSIAMLISTFVAILELTRLRRLRLQQNEAFSDIVCYAVNPDEDPEPENNTSPDNNPGTE